MNNRGGCLRAITVPFITSVTTVFVVLFMLKLLNVTEITWFAVFFPLIVGAAIPVVLFIIVVAAAFIIRAVKGDTDDKD